MPGTILEGTRMLAASFDRCGDHPVVYMQSRLPAYQALLPDSLYRVVHPAHITRAGYAAQLAGYQLINGLVQLSNLSAGQSFLHASAMTSGSRRVAVVAHGAMGKTGSLLHLVGSLGWRYLSDDWTVIEDSGVIHRSHKAIQVYARNLGDLPEYEALLLADRPAFDRFSWRLRKAVGRSQGMRRSVRPAELFSEDGIGTAGPLTEALLVRRDQVTAIVERDVEAADAAAGAGSIVAKELAPSLQIIGPHLGQLTGGVWTNAQQVHATTEDLLIRALSACERREIRVPMAMSELEIERFLVDRLGAGD